MKKFLNQLGQWIFKNKWKTILAWVVMLGAIIGFAGSMGANFNQNLKISGIPSTDIQSTIKKEFHQDLSVGTMKVVVQEPHGDLTSAKSQAQLEKKINAIKHRDGIKSVQNPYETQTVSKDKTTAYINITFKKGARLVPDSAINDIEKQFNQLKNDHMKVAYDGTVNVSKIELGATSEIIGIAIGFILLLILFRSFVSAGLPIVSAIVGLITGLLTIVIGTNFFAVTDVAKTLSIMLSLAVGIDYALFIVHRYRNELGKTDSKAVAMGATLESAGASVLFAGVTVMIAVAGLSVVGIAFLTQMGLAAAVSVFFAILSALTLLPALISLGSRFITPSRDDKPGKAKKDNLFTKTIIGHPVLSILLAVIVLAGFATPATHMRLGMPFDGQLAQNNTKRQAYDMLTDKFGDGVNSQLIGVIKLNQHASTAEKQKMANQIVDKVSHMKNVHNLVGLPDEAKLKSYQTPTFQAQTKEQGEAYVKQQVMTAMTKNPTMDAAQQQAVVKKATADYQAQTKAKLAKEVLSPVQISQDGKYAMFIVVPKTGSQSAKTEELANHINTLSKQYQHRDHTKIILTGSNAVNIDISKKLNAAIPELVGLVMLLAFILLMVVFRSVLIPLFAMVGFGMSLMAAFGLTTLVVQDGFMNSLLNIQTSAPVLAFLPVIAIGILFGLSMDYEVFMVSRIHEEYQKTGDNNQAVRIGLKKSGPVIVTAAIIMIAVFGSFIIQTDPTIKSIGIVLAFGVFFDAFLVRLIFVPAMIKLCGKYNWKIPFIGKK
ncbi:MMPL family transporter [Fructilactobacillus frigidiflavus]|uniref:MMPL family transporter n=1 Tax=Fructilactobacillus frigidiflavus TaxID=3242688 RepID=UPI0037567865